MEGSMLGAWKYHKVVFPYFHEICVATLWCFHVPGAGKLDRCHILALFYSIPLALHCLVALTVIYETYFIIVKGKYCIGKDITK